MSAKSLMVQGTASSVGKSLLVTALCRIFSRRGLRVAPFKSQNMSLNSFITAEGHEIGRAQAAQAEAAGTAPAAAMNPVLLKPSADHKSQVIVMGKVLADLDARDYYAFRHKLKKTVGDAYASLAAGYDLVIIEGAGSPAEINLRKDDIANMGMAALADAPVLLVGDIDRGGVFASLYGTVKLLPEDEQRRIRAFVINKFRGDVGILEPGLRELEAMLSRPVLGVLPYWDVRIDEEDSLTARLEQTRFPARSGRENCLDIAVIRLPRMSNFTDFAVFDSFAGLSVRYVGSARQLGRPDLVILPGSKNTLDDMRFLGQSGLARGILDLHCLGMSVIGICGGFQMLGKAIRDPYGAESELGEIAGLGLLDMETVLLPEKRTVRTALTVSGPFPAPSLLRGIEGMRLNGYEIHLGESRGPALDQPLGHGDGNSPEGAVHGSGRIFGSYLHGIFDNTAFTHTLLDNLAAMANLPAVSLKDGDYANFREGEYERLANMVEGHLDMDALENIIDGRV